MANEPSHTEADNNRLKESWTQKRQRLLNVLATTMPTNKSTGHSRFWYIANGSSCEYTTATAFFDKIASLQSDGKTICMIQNICFRGLKELVSKIDFDPECLVAHFIGMPSATVDGPWTWPEVQRSSSWHTIYGSYYAAPDVDPCIRNGRPIKLAMSDQPNNYLRAVQARGESRVWETRLTYIRLRKQFCTSPNSNILPD